MLHYVLVVKNGTHETSTFCTSDMFSLLENRKKKVHGVHEEYSWKCNEVSKIRD